MIFPNQNSEKDPRNVEFGKRLKTLFKKRGLIQSEAADILGWSTTMIYYYTNGHKQMRIRRFAELVDKLSLTHKEVAHLLEAYWEVDDDTN